MDAPGVSILILNWNGWRDTIECLESLRQVDYPNYEIILIDNGSSDDSVPRIREYCEKERRIRSNRSSSPSDIAPVEIYEPPEESVEIGDKTLDRKFPPDRGLKLILNKENYGFAEGNNIGIRHVLNSTASHYVLLLNNDTVVRPDFLARLVERCEGDQSVGVAGPKTYFYDCAGRKDVLSFAGGKVNLGRGDAPHVGIGEVDRGQYDVPREVDYAEGSCFLARVEAIRKVGLLDLTFMSYWEESDWCMKARRAGYKVMYVPEAVIWHKVARSQLGSTRDYLMTRNMFWFEKKYASRLQFATFLVHFALWTPLRLAKLACSRNYGAIASVCRGTIDGLRRRDTHERLNQIQSKSHG